MVTVVNSTQARELAETLRELTLSYKEFGNALSGVAETAKPLKRLIGEPNAEARARGSRLIAAGVALIAFPDPTITDVIGAALVAAGLIKNRMRQATVADVYKEFRKVYKEIQKATV